MDITQVDSLGGSDDCGHYVKTYDTPMIHPTLLVEVHGSGDYYVCRRHLVEWDKSGDGDMLSATALVDPIDLEAMFGSGHEVIRFTDVCTYEWDADNPVYAVGALLFAGDDIEEEVKG